MLLRLGSSPPGHTWHRAGTQESLWEVRSSCYSCCSVKATSLAGIGARPSGRPDTWARRCKHTHLPLPCPWRSQTPLPARLPPHPCALAPAVASRNSGITRLATFSARPSASPSVATLVPKGSTAFYPCPNTASAHVAAKPELSPGGQLSHKFTYTHV